MKLKHSKTQKFQRINFILNYIYKNYMYKYMHMYTCIYNI